MMPHVRALCANVGSGALPNLTHHNHTPLTFVTPPNLPFIVIMSFQKLPAERADV